MAKITKGAAGYRPADIPGQSCDNCRFFRKQRWENNGICTLVEGVILPEDTCNLWKSQINQLARLGMFAGGLVLAWWVAKGSRR